MKNKYDIGIVIGRFQPFHSAHHKLIEYALSVSKKVILVLGSARSAPDIKNPFTPEMREKIISGAFPDADLVFKPVRDYPYNDHIWTAEIQNIATELIDEIGTQEPSLAIIGHFKDRSSYYLNEFPQWSFEEFYCRDKELRSLSAVNVRDNFFAGGSVWQTQVPESCRRVLEEFSETEEFDALVSEYQYVKKYKEETSFKGVSFPPVFVTTDAVVVCSGHILLIRRGFQPGKGQVALPGGFLKSDLTLVESALKEVKEETQIRVPIAVLRGSIKASKEFDYPDRSARGRTITFAYFINLDAKQKEGLPKVKGGDDAKKAFWLPLSSLGDHEDDFFEDHLHIIRHFLGM